MKNLLIIGLVWPEPNTTAAGSRMMQLISFFQSNNYKITFVSAAKRSEKSFQLEKLNIPAVDIQLNNTSFEVLIEKINPAIVVFDRFLTEEQFGWRVSNICPNALKILDTEDLHFLRQGRNDALKNKEEFSYKHMTSNLAKREIASIYRCDLSLIISKFEFNLLVDTFKIYKSILLYLPFMVKELEAKNLESYPTFEQRNHFMTIGNFKHEPNWRSVLLLKEKIWPLIRKKLPKAELHIYGAYATEKVYQLQNISEGFIIKGWIENNKDAFINYKMCLAPLQFGAGLKGKLVDAMKFGTPSITTNIGAEAMNDKLLWNGFIEDNPKEFALKSIALYKNESLWKKCQNNGILILNHSFNKLKYSSIFLEKIKQLVLDLESHRLKNFNGLLLQHHTLQSTKYLSKWIEEKNKHK